MADPVTAFRRSLPPAARPLFDRLRRHVGDARLGGGSRRRGSGRRPGPPRSFGSAVDLDRLARDYRAWLRTYEALWAAGRPALAGLRRPGARPAAGPDRLGEARSALRQLAR